MNKPRSGLLLMGLLAAFLLVSGAPALADTLLCPGHCENMGTLFCINSASDDCPQACRALARPPWCREANCPPCPHIASNPWAQYSESVAIQIEMAEGVRPTAVAK